MRLVKIDGIWFNPQQVAWLNAGIHGKHQVKEGQSYTRIWFSGVEDDYATVDMGMDTVAEILVGHAE